MVRWLHSYATTFLMDGRLQKAARQSPKRNYPQAGIALQTILPFLRALQPARFASG